MWPLRTSRSGRPGEVWTSAPIAGPAVMSVQAQARTGTNERRARMASPPKDGARIRPTRGARHSATRSSAGHDTVSDSGHPQRNCTVYLGEPRVEAPWARRPRRRSATARWAGAPRALR
jgi:hypothetical protein